MKSSITFAAKRRHVARRIVAAPILCAAAIVCGLFIGSAKAFEISKSSSGAELKWPIPSLTYYVNSAGAPSVIASAAISAGRAWDGAGGKFRFFYGGATASHAYGENDGQNIIDYGYLPGTIVGQCNRWYSTTSGRILDSDIRLSSAKPWGGAGGYDVQTVITHEMGHAVGLADLYGDSNSPKTMYYQVKKGDTSPRILDSDDMAGIRYLYRLPDGDELAVFDRSNAKWFIYSLSKNDILLNGRYWGYPGVTPVSADFNADGYSELGAYAPSTGKWYIYNPRNNSIVLYGVSWGFSGAVPVPADYDGDGYAELAVFHAATGRWYIYNHITRKATTASWGFSGAYPVPADYNGDGFTDLGIYYPPTGAWFIYNLRRKIVIENNLKWGFPGTLPVVGDFNADGYPDLGIYHTASGMWFILNRRNKTKIASNIVWGFSGVTPLAADFNGDGRDDLGLFYAAAGTWYAFDLAQKYGFMVGVQWGYAGVTPMRVNYGE